MNQEVQNRSLPNPIGGLERQTTVNLVLSGGGAKGVAHIALIEKLEELGVIINAISGSSSGALVAALYASGMQPNEILDFFKTTPLFRYTWLTPMKPGIFDSDKYALVVSKYVSYDFSDLRVPLYVVATNLQQGKAVYFHEGELIRPLLASCAVPAVFSPVAVNGELYNDGGVMDNFPVKPFEHSEIPIIGSYVGKPAQKTKKELNGILKVTNHSNNLLLFACSQPKFQKTYRTVLFPLEEFDGFDTKKIDQIYQKAKHYLEQETK